MPLETLQLLFPGPIILLDCSPPFDIPALGIDGINVPDWATMDYLTAYNGHTHADALIDAGKSMANLDDATRIANHAWTSAPNLFGSFIWLADLPALFIIIFITCFGLSRNERI
jgi:hypothetical protein